MRWILTLLKNTDTRETHIRALTLRVGRHSVSPRIELPLGRRRVDEEMPSTSRHDTRPQPLIVTRSGVGAFAYCLCSFGYARDLKPNSVARHLELPAVKVKDRLRTVPK